MANQYHGVFEKDGDWYIGYCPEVPGANGQGKTVEACKMNLAKAIKLILEDRLADGMQGVPADAIKETITVE
ncbi:type II toxin-antitoxin system HicB family antitoxin [bacterium]|nr:type II toxin-antitoxin system HicB family antitoxin [bacterium]